MSAVRRGRKLHDRIAEMIIQPFEMHEGQIRNISAELHPVGEHHFSGNADTQRMPLVDLLETHNIGRRGWLAGRRAAANWIGDLNAIEAIESLVEERITNKGSDLVARLPDEIVADIGDRVVEVAFDLVRERVRIRGSAVSGNKNEAVLVVLMSTPDHAHAGKSLDENIPGTVDPAEHL